MVDRRPAEPVPSEHRGRLRVSPRNLLILAGACAPPAAYLLCVWHYAVNAPFQDDWSVAPLVSAARRGHLTWSVLWKQHAEERLPIPNLFFVASGYINDLNLKSIVVFDAFLFIATFFLMLAMFRIYTKRPLTFLRVLSLGILWFSFIGLDGALWAFLLTWYLALLFLFAMIFFILVWPHNRSVSLALAILVAIGASLSILQGFLLWPVGLICLLWISSVERRRYGEIVIWLATALVTTLFYLNGYKSGAGCVPIGTDCSLGANASHPAHLPKFFLTLVANAVPVRVFYRPLAAMQLDLVYVQLLGAVLCATAGFVVVRSLRERRNDATTQRRNDATVPLPLLLIVFALFFDLTIALGRTNEGLQAALQGRFTMPNKLLLVGIAAYAWAHLPHLRVALSRDHPHRRLAVVPFVVLGMLVSFQGIVGTRYGLRVARVHHTAQVLNARIAVNLDRIPRAEQGCYASVYVWNSVFPPTGALHKLRQAIRHPRRDHLIVFEPGSYRKYRAEGPPRPPRWCFVKYGVKAAS